MNNDKELLESVITIAEKEGYGNLMFIISALWRNKCRKNGNPISGVFIPALPHEIKESEIKNVEKAIESYDNTVINFKPFKN